MNLNWRSRRAWHVVGVIGTVIWLTHVALTTGLDPAHPLFDYIFIVPIGLWLLIMLLTRWLLPPERGHGEPGTGPPE